LENNNVSAHGQTLAFEDFLFSDLF